MTDTTTTPVRTDDGVDLHVTRWGHGKPVLLVHAWALSGQMWDHQIPALVDAGHSCIVSDRRGHGRSGLATTGYDLDTLANDLATVIDHFGLDDLALVGHSAGAQEVVRYLALHGEHRVRCAVLSAPMTPCVLQRDDFPLGIPEADFETIRSGWLDDFGAWVHDNTDSYFGDTTISAPLLDQTVRMLMDTPLPIVLETHRTLTRADLRADLARLNVPTTVIHGTLDTSAPIDATGRPTADIVPGARLVEIDGAGHGMYHAHTHLYNEALLAALA
ncbi:alpha/beta fold hydrolase [Ilumatobacter sp.]|uniref:alpha/beta fold hydrolase n=1 Tax=Ilumatobacter sp. TaxID=1967498 RepID=UPI003C3DD7E4